MDADSEVGAGIPTFNKPIKGSLVLIKMRNEYLREIYEGTIEEVCGDCYKIKTVWFSIGPLSFWKKKWYQKNHPEYELVTCS